ncbi:hypothetical protein [Lysobacter enzymogenes]|uniref:hypothetical protein n=1 Tax=Lysobacter enzymogenes TaxID=69 RepID=UPI001116CDEC|nr:hypothetical protein [Lysobacter enzymogenes]QQQ01284.1 hypothetical protein JHW41_25140 [Lysobacter enzymogenes]UZW60542.1 hypothetical protein BV903_025380 [Lysobacter enzymogenes]
MAIFAGDKSTFAIEASIDKRDGPPFGNVRIWLSGNYVGAYEDQVPILTFLSRMKRLLDLNIDTDGAFLKSNEAFYNAVMDGTMEDGDRYRLGLGESFDDFSLIGFLDDKLIRIIWILHDDPFFQYPNYPTGLQSATISVDLFRFVVDQFESSVRSS